MALPLGWLFRSEHSYNKLVACGTRTSNHMGIRCICPQGHAISVKSRLAGKTARCPECGSKVKIPQAETSVTAGPTTAPLDRSSDFSKKAQEISTAPPERVLDAPLAIWYLQSPNGERYGPATAELLCDWRREGRIAADILLWREGWSEWRPASHVFPDLGPPLPTNLPTKSISIEADSPRPAPPPSNKRISVGSHPGPGVASPRRRRQARQALTWVVVFTALGVLLFLALVLVLNR